MSKHTPGPWTTNNWADISGNHNGNPALIARAMQKSHDMPSHPIRGAEADANARLIAAAPDLLWAVKSAILWIEATAEMAGDVEAAGEYLAKLRAAITKAEGGS